MTIFKTLTILVLGSALAVVGCKKKDDTEAAPAGDKAAKPTETPAMAPAAAPTPASVSPAATAAGASSVTIASDDDYVAKATPMMDKLIEVFKAAGTNCDQLADNITKFTTENGATIKALDAYEKTHAEAKKRFDTATKDKTKAFEDSAGPVIKACQSNKRATDAMATLGD